ncbi:hypothetical protein CVT25_007891 [Psilocybe cyanescens]|uniref:Uncharacterized protein n=1 Tax=Psilocybe cyanescens TaxID=93625 RepID=A0A409XTJ7_PSICY|nr:hypothetical protein CVT25_007891 [Psilocybe cyanescens]
MSTPEIPIPVNVQETQINANLNSSMLLNFLMGIYTMVYGATIYIYLSKKPENFNRRIIIPTISALYLLCFFNLIVQWYYLTWIIVVNGDSRESIFLGTVDGLQWIAVLTDLLENSLLIISDGLLVDMEMLPRLGTIALGHFRSINTFSCGIRMHSASRIHGLQSGRVFNHIMTIIIESAAAYSLVLLLKAIIIVIPSFNVLGSPLSEADYYMEAIIPVVSIQGLAPTVLVARLALTDPNNVGVPATSTHISGLQFGSQQGSGSGHSGNTTGIDVGALDHTDDAEPTPFIELRRESSTDAAENQV